MKFCLFRAFPDPYRKSMQIYADQLRNRMKPILRADEELVDCLPPNVRLQPKLKRYWDQYVRYQRFAGNRHGDVNHVVDHGYGHLVRSLPRHSAIVTFHDSTVTKVSGISLKTRVSLRYSLIAMRRAARIVADSKLSRHDLLQLIDYAEDRLKVIYPGIDPAFRILDNRDAIRCALGLPPRYLLHVGHTMSYMNVEQVLRALKSLIDGGMDLKLVKVGDHFTEKQLGLIDRLGISRAIRHLGRIPFSDLPGVYNCAELLLYPVLYAGFGLPPLESMACGVPVLGSDRGALPEVLGDAAVYCDPENVRSIADNVALLTANRALYNEYQARGVNRARQYTWDTTARGLLEVYREVAHR